MVQSRRCASRNSTNQNALFFCSFLPSRTSLLGGEAVENFVFLQVRVLFYAVQILFKVREIIWLSDGYVIFRVEEFVRVCSRFKGYDLVAAAMLF